MDYGDKGPVLMQVSAVFAALREALKEPTNKWFMILNDGCLPVVAFETFYSRVQEIGESVFELHPQKGSSLPPSLPSLPLSARFRHLITSMSKF